jgi:hypothetical protein
MIFLFTAVAAVAFYVFIAILIFVIFGIILWPDPYDDEGVRDSLKIQEHHMKEALKLQKRLSNNGYSN